MGEECFTLGLYAKSGFSQLQLQSFTMERTTGEIVASVPPVKPLQWLYYKGAEDGITYRTLC